jgi:hypothetical protein
LLLFSEQKMFKLREDIRVYSDEAKTQEVLAIKARQIMDFSAAYDVVESATGQKSAPCAARARIHVSAMNGKSSMSTTTCSENCLKTAWGSRLSAAS